MKKFEYHTIHSFADTRRKELVEKGHDVIVLLVGMDTHEQTAYFILEPTEEDLKQFNVYGTTLEPKDKRSNDDIYFNGCPEPFYPGDFGTNIYADLYKYTDKFK